MDPFAYLDSLGQFTIKPGLSRMRRAMDMLGDPHLSLPSVLVAGTNGKGAVCHMTDAALSRFTLKRVLYTSPHLRSVTERILVDSSEVDRDQLGKGIDHIRALVEESGMDRLTYFETITAACFSMLPQLGADVLVSEVGLGGRWDATNVLEPQACAITSISLDHTDLLGEDVVSITSEKAGIIKPSTPLVLGPLLGCGQDRTRCIRTVLDVCSRNGSPVVLACRGKEVERMISLIRDHAIPDWRVIEVSIDLDPHGTTSRLKVHADPEIIGTEPRLRLLDRTLTGKFVTPLLGAHQAFNTACALSLSLLVLPSALARSRSRHDRDVPLEDLVEGCVEKVERDFDCSSLVQRLSDGLASTQMRGRMEVVRYSGSTIFLDGGHNVEAGNSVATTFKALFPGRKVVLLFSMMRDKDPQNYLLNMGGMVSKAILIELPLERGMPIDMLRDAAELGLGPDVPISVHRDRDLAIQEFVEGAKKEGLGLVCGSFYLYNLVSGRL